MSEGQIWIEAQQVYEEFLEQISNDWGLGHSLATEVSMNLDWIYQRQAKEIILCCYYEWLTRCGHP